MLLDLPSSVVALAVGLSPVLAAPAIRADGRPELRLVGDAPKEGRVTIDVVKRPRALTYTNGYLDIRHLAKRGGQDPVDVGSDWYIPVSIGTPGQSFLMLGDSGSPNLSIQSTLMPPAATGNAPLYNPGASSSAQQMQGYTYGECFGSGYCDNGVVYTDIFQVGNIALAGMPILVETNNTSPSDGPRSGTLGLSAETNGQFSSPSRVPSWFPAIAPFLDSGVWAVNFNPSTSSGVFDFGYLDNSQFSGDIGYTPLVDNSGFWSIDISGYSYGDHQYIVKDYPIIVDTGTGDSRLDRNLVDAYFDLIPNSSWNANFDTYQFPCSSQLLDIHFGLANGAKATIQAKYLLWGTLDGGQTCVSHILAGDGQVIWGQTFIEALYVVFDYDNRQVGFAAKA